MPVTSHPSGRRKNRLALLLLAVMVLAVAACGGGPKSYEAVFDTPGSWAIGDNADVRGSVTSGTYQMLVKSEAGIYWSVAGQEKLGDGVYEVEATQLDGPLDNGYGLIFKADNDTDNFYVFEISGDGYIWIGWCEAACEAMAEPLVGDGWVESEAVNQGLESLNRLRVEVEVDEMRFFVNSQQVAQVTDDRGNPTGDIALLVETLGEPGVLVAFDNFRYSETTSE